MNNQIDDSELDRNYHHHGKTKSPEYSTWLNMKQRCTNPKNPSYIHYGGRGIIICERWLDSFENFYADMGNKPTLKHSIERIDNNGDYKPENCKWATMAEQNLNTRKIRPVKAFTKSGELIAQYRTIGEASRDRGISIAAIHNCLSGLSRTAGRLRWVDWE